MVWGVYCIVGYILNEKYYFNDFVGFIVIYIFTAYLKKYCANKAFGISRNIRGFIVSSLVGLGTIISLNIMGLHIHFFYDKAMYWNHFISPIILIPAFYLFNIFRSIEFKSIPINHISALTLYIYSFHANNLVQTQ